jgi:hypothetical protein
MRHLTHIITDTCCCCCCCCCCFTAGTVDEVFSFLVGRLESSMRELLDTDLALYPVDKWKQQGWDFIDSLDSKREWEGFSYVDMPDPLKGMEVRVEIFYR